MKWKTNIFKEKPPEIGDRRTVTRFLLFPKTLPEFDDQEENLLECDHVETTRWLEFSKIRQEYTIKKMANEFGRFLQGSWKDIKWMD